MNSPRKAQPFDALQIQEPAIDAPYKGEAETQRRYFWLASRLRAATGLEPEDQEYLVQAFVRLSVGADPRDVFAGTSRRGARHRGMYQSRMKREMAIGWIAEVILPENEGGLGMDLKAAMEAAARLFSYSPSTLKRYWHQSQKNVHFVL